jgi:hypothetical protein
LSVRFVTVSASLNVTANWLANVRRNSQVMAVRKYDLPLAGTPMMETNSGSISKHGRGSGRWHAGHASVWQAIPRASRASPVGENLLGRKRLAASVPKTGSPSSSACCDTQSVSATAKRVQQCGHVIFERVDEPSLRPPIFSTCCLPAIIFGAAAVEA